MTHLVNSVDNCCQLLFLGPVPGDNEVGVDFFAREYSLIKRN